MQSVNFVTVIMQSGLQKIFLFLFILCGHWANAQIKFTASISPSEIGKDEYAQLKLMVENANEVQQIVPPVLKDFTIVSGPNPENGVTMINGVVKKYVALNFMLKPKAVGVFTIPPAMAKADAGDYKSNPVTVKVTAQATGNSAGNGSFTSPFGAADPFADVAPRSSYNDYILKKGENPADKIRKNMFVRVEVDKKSSFIGEPIVATYKLYTRLKSESNLVKNPSFNGFSVLDLQQPDNMNYRTERFEGRDYNVYIIRKVQLYPLLAGNLELGTAEVDNNVHFIKAEYLNKQQGLFDDMFKDFADATIPPEGITDQKVTLETRPLTILVKPLPDENKPAGFKGAVGNFTIEARIEKNNFSTDDAGKLALIVSGEGNMEMINAPIVNWPAGIEGFDSKATDDLYKSTVPVSGRKIFEFPFTVSKPGNYTLPAVDFSFFDTHEAKYKTVATRPLDITVTKGSGKPKQIITAADKKTSDNFLTRFFSNRLRVVSLFAVLIIIGLIIWLKTDIKKNKPVIDNITEQAEEIKEEKPFEEIPEKQEDQLALAGECLQRGDSKLFYNHLNLGLKNYLAKKLEIPPQDINKKNIAEQLDAKGISNETAVQLQQLIDEIEWQLYTPFADEEKMKGMYERAKSLIQLMNTYHG